MKTHEIIAVAVGVGGLIIMFVTPALISAWNQWQERHKFN